VPTPTKPRSIKFSPRSALLTKKSLLFKAASPITRRTPKSPPKGSKDKWFENLRIELRKADVRASGAWTVPEIWDRVALKMSPEEAVAILGEPLLKKFSIRKDTDEIFIYQGDLDGTGNPIKGEVRIRHNKVAKIVPPTF
jgi:hypothetical protein